MSHEASECFRCHADLTVRFLKGRPVPADEALSPGEGVVTYRVVCGSCGAVNLAKLAAPPSDKKLSPLADRGV